MAPAFESVSSSAKPRAFHKRLLEWFWLGVRMADAKRARGNMAGRAQELTRRARVSAQCASNLLEGVERDVDRTGALACDLFRQSAYWALRALALVQASERNVAEPSGSLWTAASEAVILRAADENANDKLAMLKRAVDAGSFVEFAEMPSEARNSLLQTLRQCAEALLTELDRPARAMELVWLQRALRIGMVFTLLGALVLAKSRVSEATENRRDIATGKPWRQSSRFENAGCEPPHQSCSHSPHYSLSHRRRTKPQHRVRPRRRAGVLCGSCGKPRGLLSRARSPARGRGQRRSKTMA